MEESALGQQLLDKTRRNIVLKRSKRSQNFLWCLGTLPEASNLVKVNFELKSLCHLNDETQRNWSISDNVFMMILQV